VEPALPRAARPWIKPIFVLGHIAKGVVYFLVGGLALQAAAGKGGKVSSQEGAVRTIGEQPFGRLLLVAAGIGLFCYALWRLFQAVFNPERERGAKGAGKRIGRAFSGLGHGALGVSAFQLSMGHRAADHGHESRVWIARVLAQPFGNALVAAVGLGLCAYAVFQVYCAVVSKFPEPLDGRASSQSTVTSIARIGLAARGVVFAIIGVSFVRAAMAGSSGKARDVGGALRDVAAQPYGRVLLGVVAIGVAAYGVYQLVVARHGRAPGA
jgi:hypothetical protein